MDRFLIVFPTEERLDFIASKLEQESYRGNDFPLYAAFERHIKSHGKETDGAKIYEVIEGKVKNQYIHLTTFNS